MAGKAGYWFETETGGMGALLQFPLFDFYSTGFFYLRRRQNEVI